MPDSEYTGEQLLIRDAVERLVRSEYGALCMGRRGAPVSFDHTRWNSIAQQGLTAIGIPVEVGGIGLGAIERGLVLEALGGVTAPEPYWSTAVGAALILRAATEDQKRDLLPRVASGKVRLALAFLERDTHYDWTRAKCVAQSAAGAYILTGEKTAVLDAAFATHILLLARVGEEHDAQWSIFLVHREQTGLEWKDYATVDGRSCSDVQLASIKLSPDKLIGQPGRAGEALPEVFDLACLASCSEALGAMAAAMSMTVNHLRTRKQFGSALSSFQALRHKVADMLVNLEQARSMTHAACVAFEARSQDCPRMVAAAKIMVSQAGRLIGESCIQLHGGLGMTVEGGVGQYLKRLIATDMLTGDSAFHLKRFCAMNDDPEELAHVH